MKYFLQTRKLRRPPTVSVKEEKSSFCSHFLLSDVSLLEGSQKTSRRVWICRIYNERQYLILFFFYNLQLWTIFRKKSPKCLGGCGFFPCHFKGRNNSNKNTKSIGGRVPIVLQCKSQKPLKIIVISSFLAFFSKPVIFDSYKDFTQLRYCKNSHLSWTLLPSGPYFSLYSI